MEITNNHGGGILNFAWSKVVNIWAYFLWIRFTPYKLQIWSHCKTLRFYSSLLKYCGTCTYAWKLCWRLIVKFCCYQFIVMLAWIFRMICTICLSQNVPNHMEREPKCTLLFLIQIVLYIIVCIFGSGLHILNNNAMQTHPIWKCDICHYETLLHW